MTYLHGILFGLAAALLCAGCTSGGSLPYDPAAPPTVTSAFSLPAQFAKYQGSKGWSYYQAAPGGQAYAALAWGAAPAGAGHNILECWRAASDPGVIISERKVHPAPLADAVIAWNASKAGDAQISLSMQSLEDAGGDGVAVTLWHNATRITEPAILSNGMGQSHSITNQRTVKAGDTLYLRISARESAASDWYSYTVDIVVQ